MTMMKRLAARALPALVAGAALTLASLAPARAETFTACSVKPTPDGFVALRAKPSRDAPVIGKMLPEQIVVLDLKNYEYVRSGGWISLSWFPGEAMPNRGDKGYDKVRRGWASYELIDDCG